MYVGKIIFEDRTKPEEEKDSESIEKQIQILSQEIYVLACSNGIYYSLQTEDVMAALFLAVKVFSKAAIQLGELNEDQIEEVKKRAELILEAIEKDGVSLKELIDVPKDDGKS